MKNCYHRSYCSAFSITPILLFHFIMGQIVIIVVKNRLLDLRSATNDKLKYRIWGNMFVTNQMQNTFLSCYRFNVFPSTLRILFRKTDLLLLGYTTLRRIPFLNISTEKKASRIWLWELFMGIIQQYLHLQLPPG